ncbi:MAG: serine hydroxymethyltransferase [Candidatus Dormibacteria bacterium]
MVHAPARQDTLADVDPEIAALIDAEYERQRGGLELIASENLTSAAVMEAQGSILTNKYAEGYVGRRYYGGCEYIDQVEQLAIDRAREIFGADHANVQPHSGAQANMAVYYAFLSPGDRVMGLSLPHGGHLTHGSPVAFSGRYFDIVPYEVERGTEVLDYEKVRALALTQKPKMIIAGASAYPRTLDFAAFGEIARECGAILMVDMAHIAGLVAAGLHPSPVPHADVVTSTTHKTLRGPRGGLILCRAEHQKVIDAAVFPGIQGGPLEHVIAAKAVCFREALTPGFAAYQRQVIENARHLAQGLAGEGIRLVAGGTDTHLMVADLTSLSMNGREAEQALDRVGITVSRSTIPFDPLPPYKSSGIRLGTPALTTRGMGAEEMALVATTVAALLRAPDDLSVRNTLSARVSELCRAFPYHVPVREMSD